MKKFFKFSTVMLCALLLLLASACTKEPVPESVWDSAVYTSDTTLGTGSKTFTVEVCAADKSVTFTVNTDKETVGEAILEVGLVTGSIEQYGLYIKTVNGILADYDINQAYWAFYINGEYAMTGADSTYITEGTVYKLSYEQ